MELFTARPQRIVGTIALASLVAGVPIGLGASILGMVMYSTDHSAMEVVKSLAQALLVGPFLVFICGLIFIAPALSALRYFGYGGPFFVYAISMAIGLVFLKENLLSGLMVIVMGLAASFIFCRYAYLDDIDFASL
ncbi:MAG: hypothetical protein M3R16_08430 [Pseudomonadota bacterium]|nr:hypothetical protein [Pseudomonadota bacterium]